MLVHLPIAFWSLGTVCDGLALLGIQQAWQQAWLLLAVGSATAVPAAIAGMADLGRLKEPAVAVGVRHMLLMGVAWSLYLAALVARIDGWAPLPAPHWLPVAFSIAGFAIMAAGGWHGGQLVYRLGAGVERAAGQE
jgi:uncharacterized membrane protein